MKAKEGIIEALDAIQREAEPGGTRAAVVIAMAALGAVIESDWPSPGHFELLNGKPNGTCNYRIKPVPKVRPLTAEEWPEVAGCIRINGNSGPGREVLPLAWTQDTANWHMTNRSRCHPPGFPKQVRPLWVEVAT